MNNTNGRQRPGGGRRQILVVEDEMINRELLGMMLSETYDVIYAENGQLALEQMHAHQDTLSLVLLDILMPVMTGLELLAHIKNEEPALRQIPIIVLTADQQSEVESLDLGASDFIPKPYPQQAVILARIHRTIELYEDRRLIGSTERDPLTGVYTREYFYSYAAQYDRYNPDTPTDAMIIDVSHFHMINERFGAAYGDELLRRIGASLRTIVLERGGIAGRRAADMFFVYCPHADDPHELLERLNADIDDPHTRLRIGVYENTDKTLELERRFDRAKSAADSVRGSLSANIGMYDDSLRVKELYEEQLIEEFPRAIEEGQFDVFYQPQFDIRGETPVLSGAEALVRWKHPRLGMISPGVFVPLFEENGLIRTLDDYVWRRAAADIRDWKARLGFAVPVSVNVSRVDIFAPDIVETFLSILESNQITTSELFLEVTESAYTQDSERIIRTVSELRHVGFHIEMDDFGAGYSSLNMISTLPIDTLKLDMEFIRNAFREQKNTKILRIVIDLAAYLGVPVIAEGVETEEQLAALKEMGCDIAQGYYFSKPVPAAEYEQFLLAQRERAQGK